ncbi:MAG: sigma-70 family RNA polymerase sigma factor [Calditrichaeota bacterium]|nr:MAG: sigma-70 family RNA polymerase sigma factor [Calditrichota bacterium]
MKSGAEKQKEFMALASPLMDELYRTALGMTRNRLDAEDLIQEVYMKAWRFFSSFQLGTNFRAWMFRILTNTYINQYRKKKRQPIQLQLENVSNFIPDKSSAGKTWIEAEKTRDAYGEIFDDAITTALDSVPDYFRMIVLLADVNELKYQEIATILDIPLGTVMSRLHRGRKMLAKALKGYAERHRYLDKDGGA